jgi:hypothetical protein
MIAATGFAQDIPKAKLPVLTTSAGQSSDVETMNVILEQAEIGYDYCDVPSVDLIKKGVGLGGAESGDGFHVDIWTDTDTYKEGTPYKTVVFVMGASLKGMGASGLTIEKELKRLKTLIEYCKENKIFIIGVHPGGESKRGAGGSNNERVIDAIAPYADFLIVLEDSDKDGRFTKIAADKKIPVSKVKYALGIVDLIGEVFE